MKLSSRKAILSYLSKAKVARARDFSSQGIPRMYLSELVDEGWLVRSARGVYRASNAPVSASGHLADVARRIPHGVVALLSALRFHEIGTQNPSEVWLAVERHARKPSLDYPPLRVVKFSGEAFSEGVEQKRIDGVPVSIYCPAKTIADCFKYRNKIGVDVAVEALRDALQKRRVKLDDLWRYAEVCRVARVIRPYVEAMI